MIDATYPSEFVFYFASLQALHQMIDATYPSIDRYPIVHRESLHKEFDCTCSLQTL